LINMIIKSLKELREKTTDSSGQLSLDMAILSLKQYKRNKN